MKKFAVILLGMIMVVACISLTSCGGSKTEEAAEEVSEESTQEEAAVRTRFYGGYGYMGDDPVEGAVYEYMATVIPKEYYDIQDKMVSIPVVAIVDRTENEDGSVDVTGEFQVYNYTVEGDTLMTQSGGSHPGKMHLVPDGDFYKAESFEQVSDGSEFDTTAKEIFGDRYDEFIRIRSDDDAMNALRTEAVAAYVTATGLEVTKYQDYGWDPVELPQQDN